MPFHNTAPGPIHVVGLIRFENPLNIVDIDSPFAVAEGQPL